MAWCRSWASVLSPGADVDGDVDGDVGGDVDGDGLGVVVGSARATPLPVSGRAPGAPTVAAKVLFRMVPPMGDAPRGSGTDTGSVRNLWAACASTLTWLARPGCAGPRELCAVGGDRASPPRRRHGVLVGVPPVSSASGAGGSAGSPP